MEISNVKISGFVGDLLCDVILDYTQQVHILNSVYYIHTRNKQRKCVGN